MKVDKNKHIYLFRNCNDNGYGLSYTYTFFQSDDYLDQDMINKCIKSHNPLAGRFGSNFKDFLEGAKNLNIEIEEVEPVKLDDNIRIDQIFCNITGNY